MITAEKVYKDILDMPIKERERLFGVIARHGFERTCTAMMKYSTRSDSLRLLSKRPLNTLRWLRLRLGDGLRQRK